MVFFRLIKTGIEAKGDSELNKEVIELITKNKYGYNNPRLIKIDGEIKKIIEKMVNNFEDKEGEDSSELLSECREYLNQLE